MIARRVITQGALVSFDIGEPGVMPAECLTQIGDMHLQRGDGPER